jgi:hypothetical protein
MNYTLFAAKAQHPSRRSAKNTACPPFSNREFHFALKNSFYYGKIADAIKYNAEPQRIRLCRVSGRR